MSGGTVKWIAAFAHGGNDIEPSQGGMTLRDCFAGQALAIAKEGNPTCPEDEAEFAYKIADAMLSERDK